MTDALDYRFAVASDGRGYSMGQDNGNGNDNYHAARHCHCQHLAGASRRRHVRPALPGTPHPGEVTRVLDIRRAVLRVRAALPQARPVQTQDAVGGREWLAWQPDKERQAMGVRYLPRTHPN